MDPPGGGGDYGCTRRYMSMSPCNRCNSCFKWRAVGTAHLPLLSGLPDAAALIRALRTEPVRENLRAIGSALAGVNPLMI
jgi:hypothetical protein